MAKNVNTMWCFRNRILLVSFFISTFVAYAQVTVSDPVLANYLCTKVSGVMSNDCITLDTNAAKNLNPFDAVRLTNSGLTKADELLFFNNLDTLYINQNQITSFPQNISNFRSLERLQLASNSLKIPPDIHYTNPISGDTAVKLVYLHANQIDSLPPSWFEANPYTQVIDLAYNNLDTIPTFVNYPEIRRLSLRQNKLTFKDLIPILQHPRWLTSEFDLFPQKEFSLELDTLVSIGDVLTVNIYSGLESDHYSMLKDGSRIAQNDNGIFEIVINSEGDLGEYWFKIENDSFPNASDFLASMKYNLQLEPTNHKPELVKEKEIYVFSPDGDGIADTFLVEGQGVAVFYDKSGRKIRSEKLPFEWFARDAKGQKVAPGLHFIEKENGEILKVMVIY